MKQFLSRMVLFPYERQVHETVPTLTGVVYLVKAGLGSSF
jgi:hypothetical protein